MLKEVLSHVLPQLRGQIHTEVHQRGQQTSQAKVEGQPKYPSVAVSPGRHDPRGDIKSFVNRLKDAIQKQGRVGRVLQPTARIGETEGRSEAEERRLRRSVEINRIVKDPGYKNWIDLMLVIEEDAYYSLRMPHVARDHKESMDYFIGFQAGRLAVIDDFRTMPIEAEKEVRKAQKKAEEEGAKEKK